MSKAHQLHELLAESSEINIVCHNNPDPDSLASALALGQIAAAADIDEWHILYSGNISHQQNRAFVNLLDIDIQPFESATIQDCPPDSLLAIKEELEEYYETEVHHGRLYPNLDTLVDMGLVKKGKHDDRTNSYSLTQRGHREIQSRREWENQYVSVDG